MKAILLIILATPLLLGAPFRPDPIPASAKWYLHVDFEALQETDSGRILLNTIRKNHDAQITEAINIFGFDPLADLTDLALFGDGKAQRAAIILSGRLDRPHLEEVIVHAAKYTTSRHGETTIHAWDDQGKTQFAAFLGQSTVIVSEHKDLVDLAIDVVAGTQPGLAAAPGVSEENPVILGVAQIQKIDLPNDEGSKIIRNAETVEIAVSEKNERLHARLVVTAKSNDIARTLRDALAGLIAIGKLTDENINRLGIDHQSTVEGKTMDMTLNISVSKALALLSELQ